MFCIQECGTVTDILRLEEVGEIAKLVPNCQAARSLIIRYSDTRSLISDVQSGETIMKYKNTFDNYLSSQVDLMRGYFYSKTKCPFSYKSFFTEKANILTKDMSIEQQWAMEIIMSRLNLSSIYQAGALQSFEVIFKKTAQSIANPENRLLELSNHHAIAYRYFSEGYQPLKRMVGVFDTIGMLITPAIQDKYLETNPKVVRIYMQIVQCNLAFIKMEKLRLLKKNKNASEVSYTIYSRIQQLRKKAQPLRAKGLSQSLFNFLQVAELYHHVLMFYLFLLSQQEAKVEQEYGFVKKEFQNMILVNKAVIQEIHRLIKQLPSTDTDNAIFARQVFASITEHTRKLQYAFSINVHQNKAPMPSIEEVLLRHFGHCNVWSTLNIY